MSAAQMMDVKTLTRENVASHLQKYRLQLRRAGGYDQQVCTAIQLMQAVHTRRICKITAAAQGQCAMSCCSTPPCSAPVHTAKFSLSSGLQLARAMS